MLVGDDDLFVVVIVVVVVIIVTAISHKNEVHVHTLHFHMVCYDPEYWSHGEASVKAGVMVTSESSCGLDLEKERFLEEKRGGTNKQQIVIEENNNTISYGCCFIYYPINIYFFMGIFL